MNLPPFDEARGMLNVIIETPKGCRNKYNYDSDLKLFRLKKVLPAGAVFPFDFGFVPSTLGDDGDPLDVLLLMEEPAFPGCLVRAQLIGALQAKQTQNGRTERNDRLIATAEKMQSFCHISTLTGLNPDLLEQIEHFFVSYNTVAGKTFKVLRRSGPEVAKELVLHGQRRFLAAKEQKISEE
ncbi:MAG: inorganic diphosphatase [Verrucomicrobiota bacterium]|nr:inorganic diphosphatase [Verrucomicrobiota bacterium]